MSNEDMNIKSTKDYLPYVVMILGFAVAWGTFGQKLSALEDNEKDVKTELKQLQKVVNKQAVTMGGIVITVGNIEKQMENSHKSIEKSMDTQQRLLEQILRQLAPN